MISTTSMSGTSDSTSIENSNKKVYGPLSIFVCVLMLTAPVLLITTRSSSSISSSISSSLSSYKHSITKLKTTTTSTTDDDDLQFTLARVGYSELNQFSRDPSVVIKYNFLDSYDAIIEPYADNYLVIKVDKDDTSNAYYKYTICEDSKGKHCEDDGYLYPDSSDNDVPVTVTCDPHDERYITVTKYSSKDKEITSIQGTAKCIYVRREIRDLSDDDRDAALDAMHEMWTTSEKTGSKKYGENYHSSTYFVEAHHFNAAWQDGDHIHEGMGFLPQHMKMTNMFEQSMQAVDPSTSLFYWDFTIENQAGDSIFDSYMYTEDTFGELRAPSNGYYWTYEDDELNDARIPNGRWKHIKVDDKDDRGQFEDMPSPFGYLRGPWNMNPSEYVTRFTSEVTTLPGCSSYYQWASLDTVKDFLYMAPYLPHASLHGSVGGVFGCDAFSTMLEKGLINNEDDMVSICSKWGFYLKELYRGNYITPKDNCDRDSSSSCGFECTEESYDIMGAQIKKTINNAYVPDFTTSDDWDEWRDFICEGDGHKVFVGDHLESASPADPSFWPIHPTLERMFHAKIMAGGMESYDWPTDAANDYVCDKSMCYESDEGTKGYFEDCCYGHYENDQLLDFVNADKSQGYGVTNKQILEDSDPSSDDYAVNYIYNDFTWSHCDGIDFEGLFNRFSLPA